MDFTDKILKYLKDKHRLGKEDVEFLDCFCSDFSPSNAAETLSVPIKTVMYKRFKLARVISEYCFLLRKHLKNLVYEELVKALKQTKSEYLKKSALELVLKTEGIIKEPPVVSITVDQRKQIIGEVSELLKELEIDGTGEAEKAREIRPSLGALKN